MSGTQDERDCACGWLTLCTCAALIIFLSLTFTIIKPDIDLLTAGAQECRVVSLSVVPNYCSSVGGCQCTEAGGLQSCSSLANFYGGLNPTACATDPNQCAPNDALCGGGYRCCVSVPTYCTSCNSNHVCTSHICGSICVSWVNNQLCDLHTNQCYTVVLNVFRGVQVKGSAPSAANDEIRQGFGTDLNGAEAFLQEFQLDEIVQCFKTPSGLFLNQRVNTTNWVCYSIFGIFFLAVCLFLDTWVVLETSQLEWAGFWCVSLWLGILYPLLIMTPVAEYATTINNQVLKVVAVEFVGVFNAPLGSAILQWWASTADFSNGFLLYVLGVGMPLCVYVPIIMFYPLQGGILMGVHYLFCLSLHACFRVTWIKPVPVAQPVPVPPPPQPQQEYIPEAVYVGEVQPGKLEVQKEEVAMV